MSAFFVEILLSHWSMCSVRVALVSVRFMTAVLYYNLVWLRFTNAIYMTTRLFSKISLGALSFGALGGRIGP